jgi:hypothetical protein
MIDEAILDEAVCFVAEKLGGDDVAMDTEAQADGIDG